MTKDYSRPAKCSTDGTPHYFAWHRVGDSWELVCNDCGFVERPRCLSCGIATDEGPLCYFCEEVTERTAVVVNVSPVALVPTTVVDGNRRFDGFAQEDKTYRRAYRNEHREQIRENGRRYERKVGTVRKRAYRAANPEKCRESGRALYARNKEKRRAHAREYYQQNRELILATAAKNRKRRKERLREAA